MKTLRRILVLSMFFLNVVSALAQDGIIVHDRSPEGLVKSATVTTTAKNRRDSKALLKAMLKTDDNVKFYAYKIITDELGMQHEKYQQTFKGTKVEFAEFIIHKDRDGNIVSVN